MLLTARTKSGKTEMQCSNDCYSQQVIDKLINDCKIMEESIERREQQLTSRQKVMRSMRDEKKAFKHLLEEYKTKNLIKKSEIANLYVEIKNNEAKNKRLEIDLRAKSNKLEQLMKKIETEIKEKKHCEEKRNELNIKCKKSEDAINALQKKITTIKSRQNEVEVLKKQSIELEESLAEKIEQTLEANNVSDKLNKESRKLQEALKECERTREVRIYTGDGKVENELNRCKNESADLERQLNDGSPSFIDDVKTKQHILHDGPCYGPKERKIDTITIYRLKEDIKRYKTKLKLLDQEKKETRLKHYNAQVKYEHCSTELKNKDEIIQKLKVYQMHCKINVVNNQRLAEKYMLLNSSQDKYIDLLQSQNNMVNRTNLILYDKLDSSKKLNDVTESKNKKLEKEKSDICEKNESLQQRNMNHLEELTIAKKAQVQQQFAMEKLRQSKENLQSRCYQLDEMINAEKQKHIQLVDEQKHRRTEVTLYKNFSDQELIDAKVTIDRLKREKKRLKLECNHYVELMTDNELFKRWATFEMQREQHTYNLLGKCRGQGVEYVHRFTVPEIIDPSLTEPRQKEAKLVKMIIKCRTEKERLEKRARAKNSRKLAARSKIVEDKLRVRKTNRRCKVLTDVERKDIDANE